MGCTCKHGSNWSKDGSFCHHKLAVLLRLCKEGKISFKNDIVGVSRISVENARRNDCLKLLRVSNRKMNVFRTGYGEKDKHKIAKKALCDYFNSVGKFYVCEAIFKGDSPLRADIFSLDDATIIEVASSESDKSLTEKKAKYEKMGLKFTVIKT